MFFFSLTRSATCFFALAAVFSHASAKGELGATAVIMSLAGDPRREQLLCIAQVAPCGLCHPPPLLLLLHPDSTVQPLNWVLMAWRQGEGGLLGALGSGVCFGCGPASLQFGPVADRPLLSVLPLQGFVKDVHEDSVTISFENK